MSLFLYALTSGYLFVFLLNFVFDEVNVLSTFFVSVFVCTCLAFVPVSEMGRGNGKERGRKKEAQNTEDTFTQHKIIPNNRNVRQDKTTTSQGMTRQDKIKQD